MNKKNDLVVSIVKDRTLPFPSTPCPYNNLAIHGGEIKLNVTAPISNYKNKTTLYNKSKNGCETLDQNREIQVNITRDYKWKSRYY